MTEKCYIDFCRVFARGIDIRIQLCKITSFWVICLNNFLQTIVIDKSKNTGSFIFDYAKDGAVRFSISLPDFAWYLAWSMPSSQSTIVYPYFTLTNWTLAKRRYIGFCRVFARRIDIRIQLCKIRTFWVICLNNFLKTIVIDKRKNTGIFFGYAKDGAVRFSISLPDFAWYLAWSMPSSQNTIVYPYFTLTNWTLTKKRYIGFCRVFARRFDIRIQFCKIMKFWVICLNNLLQTIVIVKRKNTGTFIFDYATDGAVRFSISLPDFAWYLAWSMPSSQSTIVYPYFTLTNWTLTKKRYIGFCRVLPVESISAFIFAKLRHFGLFV